MKKQLWIWLGNAVYCMTAWMLETPHFINPRDFREVYYRFAGDWQEYQRSNYRGTRPAMPWEDK